MGGRGSALGGGTNKGRQRARLGSGWIGEVGYRQVGSIEGTPIVEDTRSKNASQPIYSSTPNAVYFTRQSKDGLIHHISYYNKDGKLIHSVDLFERRGIHAHRWDHSVSSKRVSHHPKYDAKITNRDKHYIKLANKYNDEHK